MLIENFLGLGVDVLLAEEWPQGTFRKRVGFFREAGIFQFHVLNFEFAIETRRNINKKKEG